jgi:hypothetical protein
LLDGSVDLPDPFKFIFFLRNQKAVFDQVIPELAQTISLEKVILRFVAKILKLD